MANVIDKTRAEVSKILSKANLNVLDLPDSVCYEDWIDEDATDSKIKEIAPDIAWDILDNAGMDRDLVNSICYPDDVTNEDENGVKWKLDTYIVDGEVRKQGEITVEIGEMKKHVN